MGTVATSHPLKSIAALLCRGDRMRRPCISVNAEFRCRPRATGSIPGDRVLDVAPAARAKGGLQELTTPLNTTIIRKSGREETPNRMIRVINYGHDRLSRNKHACR